MSDRLEEYPDDTTNQEFDWTMSDRPTPMTDAERIASGHEGCPATYLHHTFCEDLERKLAEMTERWEKAANAYLIEKGRHDATQAKLAEARVALEAIKDHDGGNRYNYREITQLAEEALARIDQKGTLSNEDQTPQ